MFRARISKGATTLTMMAAMMATMMAAGAFMAALASGAAAGVVPGAEAPDITSDTWINTLPLTRADLKGKVVLVEFWTFACYNCRNVEPYVKEWHSRYSGKGLIVIGVHTPEFSHEARIENVRQYVREMGIRHAVAVDNDFTVWNRFGNRYWPCLYLIDRNGIIRHVKPGEGDYGLTEKRIQQLLAEPAG